MNLNNKPHPKLISIVGYGTFITHGYWKEKQNVEVCLVNHYARIYPKNQWYPYILDSENSSFWALKFDINEEELVKLDNYEGVSSQLYNRIMIKVQLKNKKVIPAFIYIPTEKTIISQNLTLELDRKDRWREEIKKIPEIVSKFPELIY